ncbi:globin family protein [Xanthobacter autotrophicus]|uniref:globin family protein n=1 Tax=Xanthobacter autotrophicus TaxID=280 RepID=UPI00372A24B4
MTPTQIDLVQDSFAKVAPIADTAAGLFYGRLFEIAPEVKPLFKGDMTTQGQKLMATLGVVVAGLKDLPRIVPAAQNLARKHVGYGVKTEHYAVVGSALLWTLEQGLGEAFTPEVKTAWADAYGLLSSVMIAAAEAPESIA